MHSITGLALMLSATFALSVSQTNEPLRKSGYFPGADGLRLFYETVGTRGDTLVFIHGTPSTMYSIALDFDQLAKNHTLIFYDQRGGGRSQPTPDTSLQRWTYHIQDIEQLRKHFRLERVNFLGISWGSWLATLYAFHYPDRVAKMILLPPRVRRNPNTTPEVRPISRLDSLHRARMSSLQNNWQSAEDIHAVCQEYWSIAIRDFFFDTTAIGTFKGSFCNEPPEVLRTTWANSEAKVRSLGDFDFRPMLKRINVQTLIIKGTGIGLPKEWVIEWAQSLPHSRVFFIQDCGILPWLERPAAFFPVIDQFLRGSWPTESESHYKH